MSSKIIKVDSADVLASVFGSCDGNVKLIEKKFGVAIYLHFQNAVSKIRQRGRADLVQRNHERISFPKRMI